jgi:hypothetical protein
VSVLINKTLSDFSFCNTVKHEQAVNNYTIHSKRLREEGRERGSDIEGEGERIEGRVRGVRLGREGEG